MRFPLTLKNRSIPGVLVTVMMALSVLVACNTPPAAPTTAPTVAATTVVPSPAVTVTPAPTRTPRTLPPTFTPTVDASATPTITPTMPTPTQFIPIATLPEACSTFDVDRENSTRAFQIGTAPTVAWTPVQGAVRYRVTLADMNGTIVRDDIFIAETTYTFDASLFRIQSLVYSWGVYPINQAGDQMCLLAAAEMSPSTIPITPRSPQ